MTPTKITAKQAEQACRDQALAEGRWKDGMCEFHYDFLDKHDECPTCLDDAHEAWLLAR